MAKTAKPRTSKTSGRPAPAEGRTLRKGRTPRLPAQLRKAVDAARSKKATEITVLDLRKTGGFTDYFLICTGTNPRQVQAIADAVEENLKAAKVRPTHVEGYARSEWVLLDYFDFVVHVFSTNARKFYGLENLWGDAARHELPDSDVTEQAARA